MRGKPVYVIMLTLLLTLLLTSMLTLAFDTQPAEASGTIYIRADGSVEPPTANITSVDDVTYYFTDDNYDEIVVERSNIIVDGNGYSLQGSERIGKGFYWFGIDNVTVRNINIKGFLYGVFLNSSSYNTISANNITDNGIGIYLHSSSYNTISANNITSNTGSIDLGNPGGGVYLYSSSSHNTVSANNITNNRRGISLASSYNTITANNIISNAVYGGVRLFDSGNNIIYHNNFIDNYREAQAVMATAVWDNGYLSGGNYWSNYTGVDIYMGPNQDKSGSDGIGDTPYNIDDSPYNRDRYPLMNPWSPGHDVAVINVTPFPTTVNQGTTVVIQVVVKNEGTFLESFSVTAYYANTTIDLQAVTNLLPGASKTLNFLWYTKQVAIGIYTIKAAANAPGDTDTVDNTKIDGTVTVTSDSGMTGGHPTPLFEEI